MASFVCRTTKVPEGLKFTDILVKKFALGDKIVQVGKHIENGQEVGDFLVKKVPTLVDSYHVDKLVQANAKGADLKSILKRVQTTGDISLLNRREPAYGDISNLPKTTGEAFQKALDDSRKINSLSREEADLVAACRGKTPEEVIKICNEYYSKKNKVKDDKVPVPEPGPNQVKEEVSSNE